MTWQILDSNYEQAKITVIGVGGGGGNSIQHMIKSDISKELNLFVQIQILKT